MSTSPRKASSRPLLAWLALLLLFFALPSSWKDRYSAKLVSWRWQSRRLTGDGDCAALQDWSMQQEASNERERRWQELAFAYRSKQATDYPLSLDSLLTCMGQAVRASVVFQPCFAGATSLWVKPAQTVQKGSAVVRGDVLIGIVDYVGAQLARVRLIVDAQLQTSVAVLRPKTAFACLHQDVQIWLDYLKELSGASSEQPVLEQLERLQALLEQPCYAPKPLARGLLRGAGQRAAGRYRLLEGTHFSASALHEGVEAPSGGMSAVQKGDELVTAGLDGLFPAGLRLARVVAVQALDATGWNYQLQAAAILADFDGLDTVWVLPPLAKVDPQEL